MDLKQIEKYSSECVLCDLHKGRVHPVFAKGNTQSDVMICGMVPGHSENMAGTPFVGRAGKCLDQLLEYVGLSLNDVYITNIVKCFLNPGIKLNVSWIENCISYLISQIFLVKPKVIITLGADATNGLLGLDMDTKIGDVRGSVFNYTKNIAVIPTYHPSFVLRKGGFRGDNLKKGEKDFFIEVSNDFKKALSIVTEKNYE